MRGFLKVLSFVGTALMLAAVAHADTIPYGPELNARLSALENKILPETTKGIARFYWDCTGNSGVCGVGSYATQGALPANALITDTYFFVVNPPVMVGETSQANKNGSGTLAFGCSTAGAILPAEWAVSTFQQNQLYPGAVGGFSTVANSSSPTSSAGAINRWVGTGNQLLNTSPCTINAVVGTSTFGGGTVAGFVEYTIIR